MIRVELRKLVGRPRTWISIGLLCLLPVVVAVLLSVTEIAPRPGQGPTLLSAVLGNGALFPAAALGIVLPFFLPIAVAVQAGESVAGEAAAGTLRYLLVRPVGRTRLLVAKLVSVVAFTLLAVVAVAVVGYVAGVTLLGTSGTLTTTTLAGTALTPADLAWRTGVMVLYIGWSMVGLAAVSMLLSTMTDSPIAAALGGLAVLVSSTVLVTLDAAGAVRDYLPTRYWLAWVDLFRDPVPWGDITSGVLVQTGYVVVLLGAAWANFTTRDVTT
ncbi:ABC transporter permease [Phycicoccus avicenniae]|uniref:ABC transporter permease n=1 Tax=Phycicoccus avicenniae TaxID=2828860 RepID=UPI003D2A5C3E